MSGRATYRTVEQAPSAAPRKAGGKGRGRPIADLIEYFEKVDPEGVKAAGLSSAALRAGDLIRKMRKEAGLSQAELAQKLTALNPGASMSQARVSELEAGGGSQGPTWLVMEKIAEACGKRLGVLEEHVTPAEAHSFDVERLADTILEEVTSVLTSRINPRGFGFFSLKKRSARNQRPMQGKRGSFFKTDKEMQRLDKKSRKATPFHAGFRADPPPLVVSTD